MSIDYTWVHLLTQLMKQRDHRTVAPRDLPTVELMAYKSTVYMNYPLLTLAERRLSYKFALAEAYWILSGDNRVSTIAPYNAEIARFSDDGQTFFGAYGPKIDDQLDYVVHALRRDPATRQAVINIWRENPPSTKDVPCTLSAQFLIRGDALNCIYTMRSSDAWLGWPYDAFNFSMLSALVALHLRPWLPNLQLGLLHLIAGSQHLYETNFDDAQRVLNAGELVDFHYAPVNLNEFEGPDEFLAHLKYLRTANKPGSKYTWLQELVDWRIAGGRKLDAEQ